LLNAPSIFYAPEGGQSGKKDVNLASWNLFGTKFRTPANIPQVHVITINQGSTKLSKGDIDDTFGLLCGSLRAHGVVLTAPAAGASTTTRAGYIHEIEVDTSGNLAAQLWEKINPPAWKAPNGTNFLIVLPFADQKLYGAVKSVMDCNRGMNSVCCVAEKISLDKRIDRNGFRINNFSGYLSNLALKFNFKNSGTCHLFTDSKLGVSTSPLHSLYDNSGRPNTIILGSDVTHPSRGMVLGSPSVAALVGSTDQHFMNFPGSVRLQAGRQEVCCRPLNFVRVTDLKLDHG
jgi:hypothetical protein